LGAQIPDDDVRPIRLTWNVAHLPFQKSARCSGFNGAATNGKDERILFGTKTTDYGIMDGEYWAARALPMARSSRDWLYAGTKEKGARRADIRLLSRAR
jgi:hypothetical protein